MSNAGGLKTAAIASGVGALVGTIAGILITTVIAGVSQIEPINLIGGVSKHSFAPYQVCEIAGKLYIPNHKTPDENGCVDYVRGLTLVKPTDEYLIDGTSHEVLVEVMRPSLLMATAQATATANGTIDPAFVVITIIVNGKECSSNEEVVSGPAAQSFVMRANTICVIALAAGRHKLVLKRTNIGVDTSLDSDKFSYRYHLITQ